MSRIGQRVVKVRPEVVGNSFGCGIGDDTNYKAENGNGEARHESFHARRLSLIQEGNNVLNRLKLVINPLPIQFINVR
jgi:hypothetical protein